MGLAILIILLALLAGGVGLAIEAAGWLLFIAAALFVVGLVVGWTRRAVS